MQAHPQDIYPRAIVLFSHAYLCQLLHILLICLYAVSVFVAANHLEYALNYPFTTAGQTIMSLIISGVTQTFSTLYLTILVLVTQRLALVRDLHITQTLTAIHDKSSAWLGLGSSFVALMDQVQVPAATTSIMFITLYLGGVAMLHITIPASVSINTYNDTIPTRQITQLARPHNFSLDDSDGTSWDILAVYDKFAQIGLLNNMIYDIIPVVPAAVADATVNATVFTVDCGALPHAGELEGDDGFTSISFDDNTWYFRTTQSHSSNFARFSVPASGSLQTSALWALNFTISKRPTIVVSSTIPVVDANGMNATSVAIHPWVVEIEPDFTIKSTQMLACNINSVNRTVNVSATTKQLREILESSANKVWQDWLPPEISTDPLLHSITLISDLSPLITRIQDGGLTSTVLSTTAQDDPSLDREMVSSSLRMLDQFLMNDLGVSSAASGRRNISLSDLEMSIGKAIAAVFWYERNRNVTSVYSAPVSLNEHQFGEAIMQVVVLRMRLNLSVVPLAIGLGVSCMLFALTFALSVHPKRKRHQQELTAAGILELTWLLGNDAHFVDIKQPERQDLRRAGLFDVQVSAWARRKAGSVSTKDLHGSDEDEKLELMKSGVRDTSPVHDKV